MYQIKRTQVVNTNIETCWQFFSSPQNLELITPSYLNFRVLTDVPEAMFEGLLIAYKVSPILGIPVRWVTEITHVNDRFYFVDEQRVGPYKLWHHEHHFKLLNNQVEMTDVVSYIIPFGWFGRLIHRLFLRRKIVAIFDYRKAKIAALFPEK